MLKDARVQILYFNQSADVLLEFGLRGNYSMRLLTTHTREYKDFLAQLSKAVTRNNIILTVGGFSAQDRLPEILGRAVGREPVPLSTEAFRIQSSVDVLLPQDAIPLVTDSGVLAGCVIEQGEQSIIMLTEQAEHRQEVLKKLVTPYIGERVCATAPEPVAEAPIQEAPTQKPKTVPTSESQDIFSSSVGAEPPTYEIPDTPTPTPPIRRGARIAVTAVCISLAVALLLGILGLAYYVLQQKAQTPDHNKVFLYAQSCPTEAENERVLW